MKKFVMNTNTQRGEVAAFGRVKIPKIHNLFEFEIPLLSFIVEKTSNGFVATCIHLQIDGYGDTLTAAQLDMVENVWQFLLFNFTNEKCKENAWYAISDLFKSNEISNEIWDIYHDCQITLAQSGIATDKYSLLLEKIKMLQAEVDRLQLQASDLQADNDMLKNSNEFFQRRISLEIMKHTIVECETVSKVS